MVRSSNDQPKLIFFFDLGFGYDFGPLGQSGSVQRTTVSVQTGLWSPLLVVVITRNLSELHDDSSSNLKSNLSLTPKKNDTKHVLLHFPNN